MGVEGREAQEQALKEAQFCQTILAKSGGSVLHATLGDISKISTWNHYPPGDVFDPETGAQWYYHCHPAEAEAVEHGHFHCFVRPDGLEGPIHHLLAIGVSPLGQLVRIFTVNHWVVGDDWLDATATIALLPRFDIQLDQPSYLVNRWLTAVMRYYTDEVIGLIEARDETIATFAASGTVNVREDRSLEVTSELRCSLP